MTDTRKVAGRILDIARQAVTVEREGEHGDATASFVMVASMWKAYLTSKPTSGINSVDVANMMAMVKMVRPLFGNPTNADHYADGAGYTALAGMLAGCEEGVMP